MALLALSLSVSSWMRALRSMGVRATKRVGKENCPRAGYHDEMGIIVSLKFTFLFKFIQFQYKIGGENHPVPRFCAQNHPFA